MCDLGIYGGWLTVNRFCNMRCAWCYAAGAAFKPEDSMPLDMSKRLVDLMHEVGRQECSVDRWRNLVLASPLRGCVLPEVVGYDQYGGN